MSRRLQAVIDDGVACVAPPPRRPDYGVVTCRPVAVVTGLCSICSCVCVCVAEMKWRLDTVTSSSSSIVSTRVMNILLDYSLIYLREDARGG